MPSGRSNLVPVLVAVNIFLIVMLYVNFYKQSTGTMTLQQNNVPCQDVNVGTPKNVQEEACLIPSNDVLKSMPEAKLADFFYGYIYSVQALCNRRVRYGTVSDGGWDLCEEPKYKPDPSSCLVYSFGISGDHTFDAAMEKYGCEVHSFDPSLGNRDPSKGEKFHFHKIGLGGTTGLLTEKNRGKGWTIKTLGEIRKDNGHDMSKRRLDIVKVDVEQSERDALEAALKEGSLRDVTQLNFEMHLRATPELYLFFLNLLRDLWYEGFRIYHTNRNVIAINIFRSSIENKHRTAAHELYMMNLSNVRWPQITDQHCPVVREDCFTISLHHNPFDENSLLVEAPIKRYQELR